MQSLKGERVVQLPEAANLLRQTTGASYHPATLNRWARFGVRGVRLESILVGGRRLTSKQALDRFINRLNAADEPPSEAST